MTTPTFRDWAVMYERASWEFIEYDDVWSEEFLPYILSRIERKEKALHDRADRIMEAVAILPLKLQAERSRIAERVRGLGKCTIAIEYGDEFLALADDIEKGKV